MGFVFENSYRRFTTIKLGDQVIGCIRSSVSVIRVYVYEVTGKDAGGGLTLCECNLILYANTFLQLALYGIHLFIIMCISIVYLFIIYRIQ